MSSYKSDPDSWTKAAAVFQDSSGAISGLAVPAAAGGGPAQVDAAIAEKSGELQSQLQAFLSAMAAGIAADSKAMSSTASAYSQQEAVNRQVASRVGKG